MISIIAARVPGPCVSIVIVAHNSLADLRRTVPALLGEIGPRDELIIVDSGSCDGLAAALPALAPDARLLYADGNVGFAAGANLGARAARGDLLVLLNPDAVPEPGFAPAIRAPRGGPWAAWMGLVTLDGGAAINTSGGVLHFTGLGWAGQAHEPVDRAPMAPAEVGFLSGACLAIPRATFERLGGFPAEFFMYCEDVDLSLRLRLGGGRLAVVPAARVVHDYDFDKGARKWRWLERNRWATIIRTYPAAVLLLVAPALVATEAAIWAAAIRGGWARMKALATFDLARALPRLLRERASIQGERTIASADFAAAMSAELSSPYLGRAGASRRLDAILRAYWAVVCRLLRASSRAA